MDSEKASRLTHHFIQQRLQSNESSTNASTLKLLLQTTSAPSRQVNTNLSPTGTFKYIQESYRSKSHYSKSSTSAQRIRRPLNCFMVFSHLERKRVAEENPELHNADLSKILGQKWKSLTPSQRQPYINEAERIRQLHTEIYPHYKYQPRRKNSGNKKNTTKVTDSSGSDESGKSSPVSISSDGSPLENTNKVAPYHPPGTTADTSKRNQEIFSWSHTPNMNHQNPYEMPQGQIDPSYINYQYQYENQFNFSPVTQNPVYDPNQSFPPTPEVSPSLPNQHQQMFIFPNNIEQGQLNAGTFSQSFARGGFSSSTTLQHPNNQHQNIQYNNGNVIDGRPMPLVKSASFKNIVESLKNIC